MFIEINIGFTKMFCQKLNGPKSELKYIIIIFNYFFILIKLIIIRAHFEAIEQCACLDRRLNYSKRNYKLSRKIVK